MSTVQGIIETPAEVAAREERARRVEAAIHSGEMEGLSVTPELRADAEAYLAGDITSSELVARTRARYGLH